LTRQRRQGDAAGGIQLSHVYCPECGFQNPEAANFCSKCGAALVRDTGGGDTTMAFDPDELEEASPLEDLGMEGPALVVRSGGGRAGEHFVPKQDNTTIGRSPDCDIFLDDVTVSRRHAEVARSDEGVTVKDLGSLNGSYVNGERVDERTLSTGDEVQIGRFKLLFVGDGGGSSP
jgi:hypothetical protein